MPLDPDSLAAKIVDGGRGGYCFEQNLLFKAALEALGYEVEPHLARVRVGLAPGQIRGRTHLLLRVSDGERLWHADVGFGSGTLMEPIPWGPGAEHEQSGWRFRVVEDEHGEWALQSVEGDAWRDVYGFVPQPSPMIDIEMNNWWTATFPGSPFVAGFLISRQWADGRRLVLSDWGALSLVESTPAQTSCDPARARGRAGAARRAIPSPRIRARRGRPAGAPAGEPRLGCRRCAVRPPPRSPPPR